MKNGKKQGNALTPDELEFVAAQLKNKWVDVCYQLPEIDKSSNHTYCLVWDNYHKTIIVRPFNREDMCWDTEDGDDYYTDAVGGKITHWMPLPKRPGLIDTQWPDQEEFDKRIKKDFN